MELDTDRQPTQQPLQRRRSEREASVDEDATYPQQNTFQRETRDRRKCAQAQINRDHLVPKSGRKGKRLDDSSSAVRETLHDTYFDGQNLYEAY